MNPVLYAVIGTIVVLGLLFTIILGGRTSTTFNNSRDKLFAVANNTLKDFSDTKQAVSNMQISYVTPNSVVYNGTPQWDSVTTSPSAINDAHVNASYQVFSGSYGLMKPKTPNSEIFTTTSETDRRVYTYKRARVMTGASDLGTSTAEVLMFAPDVTLDFCRIVNNIVGKDALNATPVASGLAGLPGAAETPQLSGAGTSIGTFTVPSTNGSPRLTGCVSVGTSNLIAYQVLVVN